MGWLKSCASLFAVVIGIATLGSLALTSPYKRKQADHEARGRHDDALDAQLEVMVRYVASASWVDRRRVMLAGSGEAAPIVAGYRGGVRVRVTLGDPCLLAWQGVSASSPLLMLRTSAGDGLALADSTPQPIDTAAVARGAAPQPPVTRRCRGLPGPVATSWTRVIVAPGELGMHTMPDALRSAQRAAYEAL